MERGKGRGPPILRGHISGAGREIRGTIGAPATAPAATLREGAPAFAGRPRRGLRQKVLVLPTPKLRRNLALLFGVTLLFWLAARLGLVFNDEGYLTPVWPPAAVACV